MTAAWAGACASLVLLDVDPVPLAARRARARGLDARCRAHGGRRRRPTRPRSSAALAGASFDVVVLSALLEHLPEPDRALAALAPALAPGGRIVVFVPADGPILAAKRILRTTRLGALVRGLSLEPAPGHLQRFDRRSLAALLARHGRVTEITFDPAVLGYLGVVRRPRAGG